MAVASAIVAAAATALQAGVSVGAAAASQTTHGVRANMHIENYTRFTFTEVSTCSYHGNIAVIPADVLAGRKEQLYTHKSSDSAYGTWGVIRMKRYSSTGNGETIDIMWCLPYNFHKTVNVLTVVCTSNPPPLDKERVEKLYYSDRYKGNRKEYYDTMEQVHAEGNRFKVVGIMGNSHSPDINIKIIPQQFEDFAEVIKSRVRNPDRK